MCLRLCNVTTYRTLWLIEHNRRAHRSNRPPAASHTLSSHPTIASPSLVMSFPTELCLQVCAHLDRRAVRAVRFLSKQWARAGLNCVLEEVNFILEPMSISRLEAIANDPVCSKLVRYLGYKMDTLVSPLETATKVWPYWTWSDLGEMMSLRDQFEGPGIRRQRIRCNKLAWFQFRLERNHQKRRSLYGQLLQGFPNLQTIKLTSYLSTAWFNSLKGPRGSTILPFDADITRGRTYQHGAD